MISLVTYFHAVTVRFSTNLNVFQNVSLNHCFLNFDFFKFRIQLCLLLLLHFSHRPEYHCLLRHVLTVPRFFNFAYSRHQRCDKVNKSTVINACRALYEGLLKTGPNDELFRRQIKLSELGS